MRSKTGRTRNPVPKKWIMPEPTFSSLAESNAGSGDEIGQQYANDLTPQSQVNTNTNLNTPAIIL